MARKHKPEEIIGKLREALRDAHPVHRLSVERPSFLDEPRADVALNHLYLNTDLGTLGLLGSITGVGDFERVARDAVEFDLFGHRIRAISLDDLITAKEALGRDKDLIVAKESGAKGRFGRSAGHRFRAGTCAVARRARVTGGGRIRAAATRLRGGKADGGDAPKAKASKPKPSKAKSGRAKASEAS